MEDKTGLLSRDDGSSSSYLHVIYKQLPQKGQEFIRSALWFHVQRVAKSQDRVFSPEAADELLLAINGIYSQIPASLEKRLMSTAVLQIFQQDRFKQPRYEVGEKIYCTNHWRAAQTLVALGYQAPISFWSNMVDAHGADYANVAFSGMWRNDFDGAIRWLRKNSHREKVIEGFIFGLPLISKRLGKQKAIEAIDAVITEKISLDVLDDLLKIKQLIVDHHQEQGRLAS